jgi:hypothetical protein
MEEIHAQCNIKYVSACLRANSFESLFRLVGITSMLDVIMWISHPKPIHACNSPLFHVYCRISSHNILFLFVYRAAKTGFHVTEHIVYVCNIILDCRIYMYIISSAGKSILPVWMSRLLYPGMWRHLCVKTEAAGPSKMYKGTCFHIPKDHIYIVSFMSCVSLCMMKLARNVIIIQFSHALTCIVSSSENSSYNRFSQYNIRTVSHHCLFWRGRGDQLTHKCFVQNLQVC